MFKCLRALWLLGLGWGVGECVIRLETNNGGFFTISISPPDAGRRHAHTHTLGAPPTGAPAHRHPRPPAPPLSVGVRARRPHNL
jgi:hypothetical protein